MVYITYSALLCVSYPSFHEQAAKALDSTFSEWEERDREAREQSNWGTIRESDAILFSFVQHSARPTSKFLQQLAHDTKKDAWERFARLVFRAVESAKNPLACLLYTSPSPRDA